MILAFYIIQFLVDGSKFLHLDRQDIDIDIDMLTLLASLEPGRHRRVASGALGEVDAYLSRLCAMSVNNIGEPPAMQKWTKSCKILIRWDNICSKFGLNCEKNKLGKNNGVSFVMNIFIDCARFRDENAQNFLRPFKKIICFTDQEETVRSMARVSWRTYW